MLVSLRLTMGIMDNRSVSLLGCWHADCKLCHQLSWHCESAGRLTVFSFVNLEYTVQGVLDTCRCLAGATQKCCKRLADVLMSWGAILAFRQSESPGFHSGCPRRSPRIRNDSRRLGISDKIVAFRPPSTICGATTDQPKTGPHNILTRTPRVLS